MKSLLELLHLDLSVEHAFMIERGRERRFTRHKNRNGPGGFVEDTANVPANAHVGVHSKVVERGVLSEHTVLEGYSLVYGHGKLPNGYFTDITLAADIVPRRKW